MNKNHLPLLLISLLFVAFRIASCLIPDFPMNSAPIAALFLCSTIIAGRTGLWISSILFLLTYPVLSLLQGYAVGSDLLTSLVGFGAIALLGLRLQGDTRPSILIGGSLACAVGFYLFANTMSWLTLPFYDKNFTGFYYAQWGQHPSLAQPTWHFLRNSLVANGAFALLLTMAQWKSLVSYERNSRTSKNLSL